MPTLDISTPATSSWLGDLTSRYPAVVAVIVALVLIVAARAAIRMRPTRKDPTRMFSAKQRTEGFARANGRCELERAPFLRCKGKASHGDHHYPWSKGGATSMGNFTAACVRCNLSKGAKIATFFSTLRMETRRRRYFPRGVSVKAGEKFAHR